MAMQLEATAPLAPRALMSSMDAMFLYLERASAPLQIGCVAILEGTPSRDELTGQLRARLPRLHRYSQHAVGVPFSLTHPVWEDDPAFDVEAHVKRFTLSPPGDEPALIELVQALYEQPLDRSRPLWEMHVLEGLAGDRTALLLKVHHCMIDGVAGVGLLEQLFDEQPGIDVAAPERRYRRAPGASARTGRAVAATLREQARTAAAALATLRHPEETRTTLTGCREAMRWVLGVAADGQARLPWNAAVGRRRTLAFDRLPMEDVRRIRAARGGTVNDVVVTVLAGGLHRYLRSLGASACWAPIRAAVPVSLRPPTMATSLGNRISILLVPLEVGLMDEPARLERTRAILEGLKAGSGWRGVDTLLRSLDLLPPSALAALTRRTGVPRVANLIATNVPGPREVRYFGRHRVEALYPLVPICDGLGLGLAVFSYAGWLHVGLNGDAERVPEIDKLRAGIQEAFVALLP